MGNISTKQLFDEADSLAAERLSTLEKQKANREVLRHLDTMGMLSEDESARLEEYYPIRTRATGEQAEEQA